MKILLMGRGLGVFCHMVILKSGLMCYHLQPYRWKGIGYCGCI